MCILVRLIHEIPNEMKRLETIIEVFYISTILIPIHIQTTLTYARYGHSLAGGLSFGNCSYMSVLCDHNSAEAQS